MGGVCWAVIAFGEIRIINGKIKGSTHGTVAVRHALMLKCMITLCFRASHMHANRIHRYGTTKQGMVTARLQPSIHLIAKSLSGSK
jgi:hypothetical protein